MDTIGFGLASGGEVGKEGMGLRGCGAMGEELFDNKSARIAFDRGIDLELELVVEDSGEVSSDGTVLCRW